jgi:hypothetical protein
VAASRRLDSVRASRRGAVGTNVGVGSVTLRVSATMAHQMRFWLHRAGVGRVPTAPNAGLRSHARNTAERVWMI